MKIIINRNLKETYNLTRRDISFKNVNMIFKIKFRQ
jgi:hypothetical protein